MVLLSKHLVLAALIHGATVASAAPLSHTPALRDLDTRAVGHHNLEHLPRSSIDLATHYYSKPEAASDRTGVTITPPLSKRTASYNTAREFFIGIVEALPTDRTAWGSKKEIEKKIKEIEAAYWEVFKKANAARQEHPKHPPQSHFNENKDLCHEAVNNLKAILDSWGTQESPVQSPSQLAAKRRRRS